MRKLLVLLVVLVVAGCSSKSDENTAAKEIRLTEALPTDAPEWKLFDAAKRLYGKGLYSVARSSFQSLQNSYPLGAYSEFAEIKIADSHFELGEYEDAAVLYRNFVRDHPASLSYDYALLQAAQSLRFSYRGLGRDKTPLKQAVEQYDKFINERPDSIYLQSVVEGRQVVLRDLEAAEKDVIAFYEKRGMSKAVQVRTAQLDRELEAHKSVKVIPVKASLSSRSLPWQERKKLTTESKLTPKVRTKQQASSPLSITCTDDGQKLATVRFKSEPTSESVRELRSAEGRYTPNANGVIELALPSERLIDENLNCFQEGDLFISKNGKLRLEGINTVEAFVLQHPTRLILLVKSS